MSTNKNHKTPIWKGPVEDGITFSLLSKFVVCRERFRLLVVEGLQDDLGFNHAIEYGSIWHAAEESIANGKPFDVGIQRETSRLNERFPDSGADIAKWSRLCSIQFPIYQRWFHKHPDTRRRHYIMAERNFRVPYVLPSGRTIVLRGKVDAAFQQSKSVFIQENKSKGTIDEEGIAKTIHRNLQAMLYFVAYNTGTRTPGTAFSKMPPASGILYNVIRRPLSDHYAIRQKKSESFDEFMERVAADISKRPKHFFMRWLCLLHKSDIEGFKVRMFHPLLESLLDWWKWISVDPFNPWRINPDFPTPIHWETPHGCYNSLASGFRGDYFEYLATGSTRGLKRIKTLYPELATHTPAPSPRKRLLPLRRKETSAT